MEAASVKPILRIGPFLLRSIGAWHTSADRTMRAHSCTLSLFAVLLCHAGLLAQGKGVGRFEDTTYLSPVRPGEPGKTAFCNQYARRFIYPPAFEFTDSSRATAYRFTVTSVKDSQEYTFTAANPWAPLTPVWNAIPAGEYMLRVAALPAGRTIGERPFMKSPHFRGVADASAYTYVESARRCFDDLFGQDKLRTWLTEGKPYPHYPKWIYPAKMMGSLAAGMSHYAGLVDEESKRKNILTIARRSADFLLSMSEPAGSPWAFCPPTFWDGVDRNIHPVVMGELMTSEPAETGMCYLDLFEATHDTAYREAAIRIGATYARTQLAAGTWYQRVTAATGEAREPALMIPAAVIVFFDRLITHYGRSELRVTRDRAFRWCMEHPMVTYNWEAQFEDTRPRDRYKNQSHREAVIFAGELFRESKSHPEYRPSATELLRWAEDSFCVWDRSDPVLTSFWFKPNARWNGNDPYFGSDWFVPCAVEQYAFFTPINGSSADFIDAFAEAFRATGDSVYLAKAVALANTLTLAQRHWGGGDIPTHLRSVMPELNWMNCSLGTAMSLLRNAKLLTGFPGVR
jgi:hypothetical protein